MDGSKQCAPKQKTTMMKLEGKRVIIYAQAKYSELPSLNFYSVEDKRDVLQLHSTTMLFDLSPSSEDSSLYKGIFYINPILGLRPMSSDQDFKDVAQSLI